MMPPKFSSEPAANYFKTLPPCVQENIMQCSGCASFTEEELRSCAAHILLKESTQSLL